MTGSAPAPPGPIQIIKWPAVSASCETHMRVYANTHQQIGGGSSSRNFVHATGEKTRLDSQK